MAVPPRWIFLLPVLAILLLSSSIKAYGLALDKEEEEFHEELLLKPLPDRKVLAHFHFQTRAPSSTSNGHHHHLFPKTISQLVNIDMSKNFRLRKWNYLFTQGRWSYERWGGFATISSKNANLPGVELLAVFNVPKEEVDASWKNLTHTLSGLFCASINFLESSTMYSAPGWSFRQASGSLRYGMLPREAVCTENLTPWLKLLPCRDKVGLSALRDRPSIYKSFYHSQRLHLTSNAYDPEGMNSGIVLEQTLTVVLRPSSQRASSTHASESYLQPSWSLSSIFGRKVNGRGVLAKSGKVYLQLQRGLVAELKKNVNYGADYIASEGLMVNPALTCFFMGSENERGAIAILLKSTDELDDSPLDAKSASDGYKISPGMMEMVLKLPCGVKSAALILEFDKEGLALHCFLV
ncbi:hypothetical protein NC651_036822 [Populus alba x Populus x berolinensis]|nr:hypothetical protein NC651_036822 [Populus alba x Populus x berolinensis]